MIFLFERFWKKHGWNAIFIIAIFGVLLLWLSRGWIEMDATSDVDGMSILHRIFSPSPIATTPIATTRTRYTSSPSSSSPSPSSKGEEECKRFVEFYFQKPFHKIRPQMLTNPITNSPLELDIYNKELNLAIEYNGSQHYVFNKMMHNNSKDRFQNQQYRDYIKRNLCKENGIDLIIVPYTIKHDQIANFLLRELSARGYSSAL
jgi:hypothetical protein